MSLVNIFTNIFYLLLTATKVKGENVSTRTNCDNANGWLNAGHGVGCLWFPESRLEKYSYANAQEFCASKDGYLIELHSKEQMDLIRATLNNKQFWGYTWGGATNVDKEGCWMWGNSNTKVESFVWFNQTEPENSVWKNYFCFNSNGNKYYGDACAGDLLGMPVCQKM